MVVEGLVRFSAYGLTVAGVAPSGTALSLATNNDIGSVSVVLLVLALTTFLFGAPAVRGRILAAPVSQSPVTIDIDDSVTATTARAPARRSSRRETRQTKQRTCIGDTTDVPKTDAQGTT